MYPVGRPVRATVTLYPVGRPVRATVTLYPIGRPVRATVTLYPIGRPDMSPLYSLMVFEAPSKFFLENMYSYAYMWRETYPRNFYTFLGKFGKPQNFSPHEF